MKTQPAGLQTDLLKCSRETREWVLTLSGKLADANGALSATEMLLEEKAALVDLMNEGHPMDGELWAAMKNQRDSFRLLCLAAVHLLQAATGPEGGPTSWDKTRAEWLAKAERLLARTTTHRR